MLRVREALRRRCKDRDLVGLRQPGRARSPACSASAPRSAYLARAGSRAMTSAASAICGTHLGADEARDLDLAGNRSADSRSTRRILSDGRRCRFSFCKPVARGHLESATCSGSELAIRRAPACNTSEVAPALPGRPAQPERSAMRRRAARPDVSSIFIASMTTSGCALCDRGRRRNTRTSFTRPGIGAAEPDPIRRLAGAGARRRAASARGEDTQILATPEERNGFHAPSVKRKTRRSSVRSPASERHRSNERRKHRKCLRQRRMRRSRPRAVTDDADRSPAGWSTTMLGASPHRPASPTELRPGIVRSPSSAASDAGAGDGGQCGASCGFACGVVNRSIARSIRPVSGCPARNPRGSCSGRRRNRYWSCSADTGTRPRARRTAVPAPSLAAGPCVMSLAIIGS